MDLICQVLENTNCLHFLYTEDIRRLQHFPNETGCFGQAIGIFLCRQDGLAICGMTVILIIEQAVHVLGRHSKFTNLSVPNRYRVGGYCGCQRSGLKLVFPITIAHDSNCAEWRAPVVKLVRQAQGIRIHFKNFRVSVINR